MQLTTDISQQHWKEIGMERELRSGDVNQQFPRQPANSTQNFLVKTIDSEMLGNGFEIKVGRRGTITSLDGQQRNVSR